ncbi:unnamed protein product [Adineta steineri]|uniref:Methyltransferase-like protein n=1 Tax=Adineta steineri TaxID=433720 RepID=A0A813PWE0_9BILA|nr:unnamed protein product [Adineta steineri]CAF0795357.1 unnamed protein product [Adineta steineri]
MAVDIIQEISFFTPPQDGSAAWMDFTPTLVTGKKNFVPISGQVTIHDLRNKESSIDLDTHGFEVLKYDGDIHNEFDNDSEMQRSYYEDIVALLKKRLGASSVVIFNHIFRFRGSPLTPYQCDSTHKNPGLDAHVDIDPSGVPWKVEQLLGEEEAKKAMHRRFQMINIWRPIGPNPVMNIPLALCDYRSVDVDKDMHVVQHRGTPNSLSGYAVSHNAQGAQKWYYLSQMRSDEMFVFKIFDSKPDVAQFGAHAAFINKHVPPTNVEQKSIEVRCLVFYDQ